MMADSGFSSKRQSGLWGSLVLRVLTVCLTLVVVPLLIYGFLIYRQEQKDLEVLRKADTEQLPSRNTLSHLAILFSLIFIFGGALTYLITRRMAKPLAALSDTMDKVAGGELAARYPKDRMGFEINVLGSHFNKMVNALVFQMESAKKERLAREVLANELRIGHEIQKSLFPKSVPDFPGLDIASGFIPAKEVAGDFYDLFTVGHKLMIVIADASDKGISACLYSLAVRSILRAEASSSLELPEIIRKANALFCLDTEESGTFVTAWVGIYDSRTRVLEYTSCGHPFAVVKRPSGIVEQLATSGIALGVVPFDQVPVASVQLSRGDLVLLYTDGVIEAHDLQEQLYGKKRLLNIIGRMEDPSSQAMVDAIFREVENFSSGAEQHDDMTLLALRLIPLSF